MEKKPAAWQKRGVFALISRRGGLDSPENREEDEEDFPDEEERRKE